MSETTVRQSLSAVLVRAEEVLASGLDSEEGIARFEAYSEELSCFQGELEREGAISPELESDLRRLNSLHEQILERAVREKDNVQSTLSTLRARGRSIMRYLDSLPRRVSIKRRRKG